MRFQIDPIKDENQRACTAILAAAMPPSRATIIVYALYAAVVGAAYLITPETLLRTALIGLAAVLATVLGLQAEGRWRLRRLQANDTHAGETYFVELDPEGVHTWCSHVDIRYAWRDITKVTENQEFYVFAGTAGSGAVIPKRLLNDTSENQLRDHIRLWASDRGVSLARKTT